MRKLRVGIVGCGRISGSYLSAFGRLLNEIEVVAAIDIDLPKAVDFASHFPSCKAYSSLEEAKDLHLDATHLALPHYLHCPFAIKALKMGINVLTEKPLAMNIEEGERMIAEAKKDGLLLGCIFQTRYNESVQTLKARKDRGDYGKILSIESTLNWHRDRDYYLSSPWKGSWDKEGGGVLIDQAIHSLDRVLYIMGEKPLSVKGEVRNIHHPYIKVEDDVKAELLFGSGALYHLSANDYNATDEPIRIVFKGEKGSFGLIQDLGWSEIDGKKDVYEEVEPGEKVLPSYWGTTHIMELRDFYQAVRDKTPFSLSGDEGLKTLAVVRGIYLSSILGQELSFPLPDPSFTSLDLRDGASIEETRKRLMENSEIRRIIKNEFRMHNIK